MKLLSLFILWLLGFCLITLLCIKVNGSSIENELTQQTRQALANNGFGSVVSTVNGQVVTLKGSAVSNEDSLQAESIAKSTAGVTDVNNQLTVITPKKIIPSTPAITNITIQPTSPMTETQENSVYPPQQTPITDQSFENKTPNINNYMPWPNNTNNFQPPLPFGNNNGLNMPFWGNNTPWGNGLPMQPWGNNSFIPPIRPLMPIQPIAPMPPVFPFETFYPIPM